MYKAPIGRVATLQDALAQDLRNLPLMEPSQSVAEALTRKLDEMSSARHKSPVRRTRKQRR